MAGASLVRKYSCSSLLGSRVVGSELSLPHNHAIGAIDHQDLKCVYDTIVRDLHARLSENQAHAVGELR